MGKRFASGMLVATMVAGILTFSSGIASATTAGDESRFVALINSARTSRGLNALAVRSDLVSVARKHSEQMAEKGTIFHDPSTWNSVSGWTVYGENVGMGPNDISDPVGNLETAFMNSTEHRRNILYPSMESDPSVAPFNQVGVGVVIKNNTMYVTQIFVRRGGTSSGSTTIARRAPTQSTSTVHRTTYYRPVASVTHTARATAVSKPKPRLKPATVVAIPQTVDLLVRMIGLDSDRVDPSTGAAAGF